MDGWISIGEAAALVVRDARSRMEEKSEAGDDGLPARLAVTCDPEGSGAGREDRRQSQGGECHAAASRVREST